MFGYDNPEYGIQECLVHGKEFWPEASPYFPIIAYNALVYISIFSIWRVLFEMYIDSEAEEYAKGQLLKQGKASLFEMNKMKYKESYWKTVTNAILMFYGFYALYYKSPQFWSPSLLFKSWPQEMKKTELIYYKLAIGYHGHRAIYGLIWEKRRVDFLAVK